MTWNAPAEPGGWLGWSIDAYAPDEMARRVETLGVGKAGQSQVTTAALAVLAGAFISLGAAFSTVAMADNGLAYSLSRLLGGLTFSLGIILVVVAGAELFTSNTLQVMAWASRKVRTVRLVRNWGIVYVGNLVGVVATAILLWFTGHTSFGEHAVALQVAQTATTKLSRSFPEAVAVGVLGNALVCLAIWLSFSARSTVDKIVAVVPPMTALVAFEFDHVVANMHYLAAASLLRLDEVLVGGEHLAALDAVTFRAVAGNLLAVTIGNLLGGGGLVAAAYWFVYLRPERPVTPSQG
jgi:formate transporter